MGTPVLDRETGARDFEGMVKGASLLTSDIGERDRRFLTGEREGYYTVRGGLDQAIARALSYAPYADMSWCETF